jgi:D-alanyl-D-alanine carboxypeptidase/D-alanyl-D-alanine-endopeptidase (penicillin-binding protein 4)
MPAGFDSRLGRRALLRGILCAGGAFVLGAPALAGEARLASLIAQGRRFRGLPERLAFISRSFLGVRYQGATLIGGPRQPEVFVVRDDRFDCVTFCETVLAAALAADVPAFEERLRAIRYHNGEVAWRARNHDFAAWCERNVANGTCRPVALGAAVALRKSIDTPRALGHRDYAIAATTRANLMQRQSELRAGDIIGFVSRRRSLDYFHTGFVMFGAKGELLLRHASQSHRRVVDEGMTQFFDVNRVGYVTVWRPQDQEKKA